MSTTNYVRKKVYGRDNEDRRGQGVFAFAPGATVSTQQAATMLGVCDDTVRSMCECGELTWYKRRPDVDRSPIRVIKESIYRHLAKVVDAYELERAPGLPNAQVTPARQEKK